MTTNRSEELKYKVYQGFVAALQSTNHPLPPTKPNGDETASAPLQQILDPQFLDTSVGFEPSSGSVGSSVYSFLL
ncbi:hypothetical protein OUZ56_003014 [Daphnia magna]|uniref:Uncharacterized protein n=1 Tax=Daphnia magna TaxID=35525 RepID=A0ABR0A7R7_9CRUS|nr:hypothetical protein OUZ56_003014 [Daphnia magna]